jgi:hypothetical protein
MIYRGRVENGVIRLEQSAALPGGSEVCVELVEPPVNREAEKTVEQRIAAIWADVPESEWSRLPADLTRDLDRHILHERNGR